MTISLQIVFMLCFLYVNLTTLIFGFCNLQPVMCFSSTWEQSRIELFPLPALLVKVSCVSKEGRREEDVADERGHLRLEAFARLLPTVLLDAQRTQQRHRAVNLVLKKTAQTKVSRHAFLRTREKIRLCILLNLFFGRDSKGVYNNSI
jgi:hypothetical protein